MPKLFRCCMVRVEVLDKLHPPNMKVLFRTTIETDSQVTFDFNKLIDAFVILYPKQDIHINFTLL